MSERRRDPKLVLTSYLASVPVPRAELILHDWLSKLPGQGLESILLAELMSDQITITATYLQRDGTAAVVLSRGCPKRKTRHTSDTAGWLGCHSAVADARE